MDLQGVCRKGGKSRGQEQREGKQQKPLTGGPDVPPSVEGEWDACLEDVGILFKTQNVETI